MVFAERCARCHSSKLPPLPAGLDLENCNGKDYLVVLGPATGRGPRPTRSRRRCARWSLADDFLKDNYLSTELRVPSTLLQTNVCSPLATNAIAGNIWDNFSSQSYKELPSVGTVKLRHPFTGAEYDYTLPGGGRGFTRPASLVSLWSTAPFLQNNTVGPFEPSPSVEARMKVVPGLDRADALARAARQGRAVPRTEHRRARRRHDRAHDRRTATFACRRATSPTASRPLLGVGQRLFPMFFRDGEVVDRTDPEGHAGQPAHEHGPARRRPAAGPAARRTARSCSTLLKQIKSELKRGNDPFANRNIMETMLVAEQVPRLRGQQGPLLRHQPLHRGAGAERRRQARSDRVPEDHVGGGRVARTDRCANERSGHGTSQAPAAHTTPTTSSSAPAPAAAPWRRGWPKRASACCCSKRAAIRARSIGATPQTPGVNSLPDDYDVPAFHALATENDGDALGLLRPPLRRRRAAGARSEVLR